MSVPLHWNVIINPNALNYRKNNLWEIVKHGLTGKGYTFNEFLSPSQERCEVLISTLIDEGQTNYIVVGGDGTLNEVVNAFLKSKNASDNFVLALIPCGTGNDWARTHNIQHNADALVNMFLEGKVISHDIGKVISRKNGQQFERFFINIAGLAFDAEVILRMNKSVKMLYGNKFVYLKNLFISLLYNKPIRCKFFLNDNTTFVKPVFSIAVGICKYNGGGMMQVPMANPHDGLLDMIIIEPMNLHEIIVQLPKLYTGTHIGYKKIHYYKTSCVTIEPEHKMFAEVEGEIVGDGAFEIKSAAQKVKVLVP